jgi:hypothetical protein
MLVLIGPAWLNAPDEEGTRSLDKVDDWVRLEIARALHRDITVIPVRVNGGPLPARAQLPADIQGLLDHQAASVANASFRTDMAGLVRDIRAIPSRRSWRRFSAIGLGIAAVLAALVGFFVFELPNISGRFHTPTIAADEGVIWPGAPGEWVLYGADQNVGFYLKRGSTKKSGDTATLISRFPYRPADSAVTGAHQDDRVVIDCNAHKFVSAETTIYNKAGNTLNHHTRTDIDATTASGGQAIPPNSVLSNAERITCDDLLRVTFADELDDPTLKYLARTPQGNGDIWYGLPERIADDTYEVPMVTKLFEDGAIKQLFAKAPVLNGSSTYRNFAQRAKLNCAAQTVVSGSKIENFDAQKHLVYLNLGGANSPVDVQAGSPLSSLRSIVCGAARAILSASYQGTINVTCKGAKSEQQITLRIERSGNELRVSYDTGVGGQGKGVGVLNNEGTESTMSLESTVATCPGSYDASFKFADDSLSFSFKGRDCGGPLEGDGT